VRYGGKQQVQEVLGQASFLSVNDKRLHFGLGQEKTAGIEVRWPSGIRQSFGAVPANRLVTVDEVKGIVKSEPSLRREKGDRGEVFWFGCEVLEQRQSWIW
jgi:hypothetical protein